MDIKWCRKPEHINWQRHTEEGFVVLGDHEVVQAAEKKEGAPHDQFTCWCSEKLVHLQPPPAPEKCTCVPCRCVALFKCLECSRYEGYQDKPSGAWEAKKCTASKWAAFGHSPDCEHLRKPADAGRCGCPEGLSCKVCDPLHPAFKTPDSEKAAEAKIQDILNGFDKRVKRSQVDIELHELVELVRKDFTFREK